MSERAGHGWVPPPLGGYQARPPLPEFPENRHVREGGGSGWPLFLLIIAMAVGFCFGVAYGLSKCHPKPRPRVEPEPTFYHAMTLKALLDIAAAGYPGSDEFSSYYDEDGTFLPFAKGGDSLARFLVSEIVDSYDAESDDSDQLERAAAMMRSAETDAAAVADALLNHDAQTT